MHPDPHSARQMNSEATPIAPVDGVKAARRGGWWLRVASVLLLLLAGAPALASSPLKIAVAPFAGEARTGLSDSGEPETRLVPIAEALTGRLATRPLERVIPPDAFVATADFEPRASVIRQWAYNAAVDTIVVGRVIADSESGGEDALRVEAVLRSGHSGAELARRDVPLIVEGGLDESAEQLAKALLEALDYQEVDDADAGPRRDPRSPEPAGLASTDEAGGSGGRGLDARLDLTGIQENAPIEINAEEAEILDRGADRKLVFQRNVKVRQGNVILESDVLEAEYRKGRSEPDRLVARGSVVVAQGDRRASCDRAIYQRLSQQLVCEGHAELIQGCDIVRGESIEFDLASDQARVEGAASIVIRPGGGPERACQGSEDGS